jgi:hypothetical protein
MGAVVVLIGGKPQLYVHNADLGTSGRVANPSIQHDMVDAVTWADNGHRALPGQQTVTMSFTGLFDSTAEASHEVLNGLQSNARVASYYPDGDTAAGTVRGTGTGIGFGSLRASVYNFSGGVGELLESGGDLTQEGTAEIPLQSLAAKAGVTGSTTNIVADSPFAASSTAGGAFYIHVFDNSASGGNARWTVALHHGSSTAAGSFAVLAPATGTFGNGTTTGTRIVIAPGTTIRRFTRAVINRDANSGSLTYQIGFYRD